MKLEFFYDVVSPYSYLALHCVRRYRALWDLELVLRPALLGGVMKSVGNAPPASLPQRAPYLVRDLGRLSRYFDVPVNIPEDFPANTLSTMRLLTAVRERQADKLEALTFALFQRHWGEGKAVQAPETLAALAADVGVDGALLAAVDDPAIKASLKAATDEVVERGAFGFPAMFVQIDGREELYFGSDRLSLLAFDLGLPWQGPVPSRG